MSELTKDLIISAVVPVAYFSLWFILATYKKRLDYADIAWGGSFVLVAVAQFFAHRESVTYAQALVCLCIVVWGLRLTLHVGKRNLSKHQEDARYVRIRSKWKNFALLRSYVTIFLLQAGLVWLISLPLSALWRSELNALGGIFLGLTIWVIGFWFESTADRQLRAFLRDPKNKGKIMRSGLWKYSRHPNYFGEITQWWGIWLMSLYLYPVWWSVIGPLTITFLIRFVSGVPPLEKHYEGNKAYQKYKAATSMLIPSLPKS